MEEITIRNQYMVEDEHVSVQDPFYVEWVAKDKAILKESIFLAEFPLLYGDEITLTKNGDLYDLVSVQEPSNMLHYFSMATEPPQAFTDALVSIGGNWECDAGMLLLVHIPAKDKDKFCRDNHFSFDKWEQMKSELSL